MAIVLPTANREIEFKVYVVFKLVKSEPDRYYKIAACMNVLIPDIGSYFSEADVLSIHQKIAAQLADNANANLEFLFQNH